MLEKQSLSNLKSKTEEKYFSKLNPLEKTTRYNILKILADVDTGIYHQLLGDIEFLSKQIFPDTAEGEYLRSHWSDRVPPLYPESATGYIIITGNAGVKIPSGCVFTSLQGNRYYTNESYKISEDGKVKAFVIASESGTESNLSKDNILNLSSNLIAGMDTTAQVLEIAGGTDGESDEEYLLRVLNYTKNKSRYGAVGDFAAWALDSSSEVKKAFEFKNFNTFGALLITVVSKDENGKYSQVKNIDTVAKYIETYCPPTIFTVLSANIVEVCPTITLKSEEDSTSNRALVKSALENYFEVKAKPDMTLNQSTLQSVIIDGINITDATLTLENKEIKISKLEFSVLGSITWA